jgi:hypothetical protein
VERYDDGQAAAFFVDWQLADSVGSDDGERDSSSAVGGPRQGDWPGVPPAASAKEPVADAATESRSL